MTEPGWLRPRGPLRPAGATLGVCQRRLGVDEGVRGTDKLMEIKVTERPRLSPVCE